MAKIQSVSLLEIPEFINVGDNDNDITVVTKVVFHQIDLKLEMEYCLHLFVYSVHGDVDAPLVIPNWDESRVVPIVTDRKDTLLGEALEQFTATDMALTINTKMALKLGKLDINKTYYSRKLEVFATITPAVGRASKWSQPFTTQIMH